MYFVSLAFFFILNRTEYGTIHSAILTSFAVTSLYSILVFSSSTDKKPIKVLKIWTVIMVIAMLGSFFPESKNNMAKDESPKREVSSAEDNVILVNQGASDAKDQSISRPQSDETQQREKLANQQTCLIAFRSISNLLQNKDMIAVSQYCYHNYDNLPMDGTNEGCSELKSVMMSLKEIYEDGTMPPPAKFEYLGRKLQESKALLENPKLKLDDLRAVASD